MICRAVQFECSAGVVKRMMVSALANAQSAVIKVSMRLPDIIVKFVIEVKRALEMVLGVVMTTQLRAGARQAAVRSGFPTLVA